MNVNTFKQVVKLKKDVIDKIYILKSKCQAETVKILQRFYESMEYFELPNQLMTERDELDLNGNHERRRKLIKYGMA